MKLLSRIDLYTGLILLCVVLLPICGWWCMKTHEGIKSCQQTVRSAGLLLEEIGSLQKKIEIVNLNKASSTMEPGVFLQKQIITAASNKVLRANDITVIGPKEEPAVIPGSRQRVSDFVVTVDWKRKDLALKLDFIEAMLWNCESGAGHDRTKTSFPSIWRLRDLDIVNVTDEKKFQRFDTPPPELEDRWTIRQLKFARREPKIKK